MKILVFSDTHCDVITLKDIIGRNRADTDIVIHLGDCWRDIDEVSRDFPAIAFLGVRGNCDYIQHPDYPQNRVFSSDGHTFYLSHGHMEGVRSREYKYLASAARRSGADTALFGHTHIGTLKEISGVTVFNPGSLSRPRDFCGGSYGVITLKDGKADFEIVKLTV